MKKTTLLDDVNIDELFKKLWKEKFLILITTVIFSLLFHLLFHFYYSNETKKLRTEIVIQNPPTYLFFEYDKFYKHYLGQDFFNIFITDLRFNLLSQSNLENFLGHNNAFQHLDFLNEKIDKNKYAKYLQLTTNKENKYFLIFPEGVNGKSLLSDYVDYTKNMTLRQSKNKIKIILKKISSSMISDLEISKNSQFLSLQSHSNELDIFYDPKILSNRIIVLNSLIARLDKENFDYDIVLINAHSAVPVPHPIAEFYRFFGIILGFFLAVLIVIFRDKIKSK
jgi:hypothetical protein